MEKGILNILEPWKFSTEKGIIIKDIDKCENQLFLYLEEPYIINNYEYNFFLAKLRGEDQINFFSIYKESSIFLEMIYNKNFNPENFTNYRIKNFREHFILGELQFR